MLKARISKADFTVLPPALQEHYKLAEDAKEGEEYQLDAEVPDESVVKLTGALKNERAQRAKAIEDAKKAKERTDALEAELAALKEKAPEDADPKGDEKVQKQLAGQKAEYDRQIQALQTQINEQKEKTQQAEARLARERIDEGLRQAAIEAKVRPEAIVDILNRARGEWKLDETGNPIRMDGETAMFGRKDPTKHMPFGEHVKEIIDSAPHLLQGSGGGAAPGGGARPGGGNQFVLSREDARDPAKYRAMKDQAAKVGQEVQIAAE